MVLELLDPERGIARLVNGERAVPVVVEGLGPTGS